MGSTSTRNNKLRKSCHSERSLCKIKTCFVVVVVGLQTKWKWGPLSSLFLIQILFKCFQVLLDHFSEHRDVVEVSHARLSKISATAGADHRGLWHQYNERDDDDVTRPNVRRRSVTLVGNVEKVWIGIVICFTGRTNLVMSLLS